MCIREELEVTIIEENKIESGLGLRKFHFLLVPEISLEIFVKFTIFQIFFEIQKVLTDSAKKFKSRLSIFKCHASERKLFEVMAVNFHMPCFEKKIILSHCSQFLNSWQLEKEPCCKIPSTEINHSKNT